MSKIEAIKEVKCFKYNGTIYESLLDARAAQKNFIIKFCIQTNQTPQFTSQSASAFILNNYDALVELFERISSELKEESLEDV